jgi:hypothetical protein
MNGNVGIGTTNPTEKLVVDDGENAQAITMAKDGFFNDQNQALLFRAKSSGNPTGSGRLSGAIHKRSEDLRVISKGNISRILFYTGTNENSGFDTEVAGNPFSGNYTNTDDIPKMTIINNGNVGIGTTNPAAKLHVQGLGNFVADSSRNMDLTAYIDSSAGGAGFVTRFGRGTEESPMAVQTGDVIFGIYSRGRHNTGFSTNNVGAIRIRASEDFTSTSNGTLIDFATTSNGSTSRTIRMTITSSGNVGIGVTNPTQGRLVVESLSTPNSFGSQFYIIRDESNGPSGQFSNQSSFTALTSIFATGMVWSNTGFLATSDSRIKKDIQNIHDGNALEKLRLIEPMEYKYVDHIQRGDKKVFGFVAQQVARTLPRSRDSSQSGLSSPMCIKTMLR